MATTKAARFPEDFVWGAATAAYQIEGAAQAGGRGMSIWDVFSRMAGAVRNGDTGDVACSHYERLEEDLDLMAALGLRAYRFSVSWPRVQPDGMGSLNRDGVDFYRRLLDGLAVRGIEPVATLYHWDLPQDLEERGGWTSRDTALRFADYASAMGDALGGQVGRWITLNEPWCSAWLGYGRGVHAPGRKEVSAALASTHHLLLGHGLALAALRQSGSTPVGITLNFTPVLPASQHPDDLGATRRADGQANRLYVEAVLRGSYPPDVVEHYAPFRGGLDMAEDGDARLIGAPIDFLGVNFYTSTVVADPNRLSNAREAGYNIGRLESDPVLDDLRAPEVRRGDLDRTAMGWEVDPGALTDLLVRLNDDYQSPPIYLTENGAACHDYVDPNGEVKDKDRIDYLRSHLLAVSDAIGRGVDVRGYFAWSLMDNFEWAYGYSRRFGLIWVDYPTGRRIPKASFSWYRSVIESNGQDLSGGASS